MLLFFAGGCGEKSYEVSKWGGGGGGGVFALNELKEEFLFLKMDICVKHSTACMHACMYVPSSHVCTCS